MINILEMDRKEILAIKSEEVDRFLTADEVIHIAKTLGACWEYDYEAAKLGERGMHAELKSGLHSDEFFVSKILLEPWNIREIIARQIIMKLFMTGAPRINCVIGVPDGATKLGEKIAEILRIRTAKMVKTSGCMFLEEPINLGETVLLVEDFCTRGTGFRKAVTEVKRRSPSATMLPYNPVIINRGRMKKIEVAEIGTFTIVPIAQKRVRDWSPNECPLCKAGSAAIKPKETDENWKMLIESQKKNTSD